jgi:hypothetical protein
MSHFYHGFIIFLLFTMDICTKVTSYEEASAPLYKIINHTHDSSLLHVLCLLFFYCGDVVWNFGVT